MQKKKLGLVCRLYSFIKKYVEKAHLSFSHGQHFQNVCKLSWSHDKQILHFDQHIWGFEWEAKMGETEMCLLHIFHYANRSAWTLKTTNQASFCFYFYFSWTNTLDLVLNVNLLVSVQVSINNDRVFYNLINQKDLIFELCIYYYF